MYLFSKPQSAQLIRNSQPGEHGKDHFPVAKLYIPKTGYTWLFTEVNLRDPNFLFGLSAREIGDINVGYSDYREFSKILNSVGEGIVPDPYFVAKYPLSVYISAAHSMGFITEVEPLLERHHRFLNPPGLSPG